MRTVYLVGCSGMYANKEVQVDGDVIIGRNPGVCQLVYPGTERGVSGTHCKVQNDNGNITLTDLGSTNGTFLQSGERLAPNAPRVLREGQSFYLGDRNNMFTLKVVEAGEPAGNPAAYAPQMAGNMPVSQPPRAGGADKNKVMAGIVAAVAVVILGIVITVAAVSMSNARKAAEEATRRAQQEAERARQEAEKAQEKLEEEQNKGLFEKTFDVLEDWIGK